jgi:sortase A
MKHEEYTTGLAANPEPANGSRGKRVTLAIRTVLERSLLVVGVALLAIYVAARIHGAITSRAAVREFEALKQAAPPTTTPEVVESPKTTSQPDFVAWSEKRVQDYKASLDQHFTAPLGVLRIPKIRLEVPVLEGTDDLTLNRGVGRIEGTAQLGDNGNVGIAGHRDGFFRGLKDVKIGDRIELEGRERSETYVVDQINIVDPSNVGVLQPRSEPSLTLVTCYPFHFIGSARQRYIVHASLTDSGTTEQQRN